MAVGEELQESRSVAPIGEDPLAGQPAVHDMVIGLCEDDAEGTRHTQRVATGRG